MIDSNKTKDIGAGAPSNAPFKWHALPIETLLRYHDEIKAVLPPASLAEMNMEEELIRQFQAVRALQNSIIDDDTIPPNQKAQVANSVASSLSKLADLQLGVFSSERFKRIETLLIRTLNKLPEELSAEFLEIYENTINDRG